MIFRAVKLVKVSVEIGDMLICRTRVRIGWDLLFSLCDWKRTVLEADLPKGCAVQAVACVCGIVCT